MAPHAAPRPAYPAGFLWGVATAGYQIEGGFNGDGEPHNNWAAWEHAGRVARTGAGVGFWHRWQDDLTLAAGLGIDAFRMSVEWARVEPAPGIFDEAALDRYADIIAGVFAKGMEPIVTLQHFTHPAWLGHDPWLDRAVPERFARYAGAVAVALGRRLAERGSGPVRRWVTVNEPNALCNATYLIGVFPRGPGRGRRDLSAALAGIMTAHVHARRALHAAHHAERWPAPIVTYNAWAASSYDIDRYLVDLLRPATRHHIDELRRDFHRAVRPGLVLGRIARAYLRSRVDRAAFAPLVAELGRDEDALDVLGVDYYHPFLGDYLGWTGRKLHPWQWPFEPAKMPGFLAAWIGPHADLPLFILENGVGTRALARPGRHRGDGRDRAWALREAIGALDVCLGRGLDIGGYLHWSLYDNYEWGSFSPRFGLHAVDYDADAARRPVDATGSDAAATYRALIAERRGPAPLFRSS